MTDQAAQALNRNYLIALAIVTILLLGDQAILEPYLSRLTTDAPLINLAGRQRMLSQRLTKAALALEGGWQVGNPPLEEMSEVLGQWSAAHDQLRRALAQPTRPIRHSLAVRHAMAAIDPCFVKLRDAAQRMIQAWSRRPPDTDAIRQSLAVLLENEPTFLERMEQIVALCESEARARIAELRRVGWIITGLILASLSAIGLFVLRPASRLIRRQITQLEKARETLETRVLERTRELELAGERQRALVDQISHVARTTTIGEMASALAHELNQPLGAIANYAEGCLVELDAPEPSLNEIRSVLERLLATTLRAGQIIDRIRKFVSRQPPRHTVFQPNEVVASVQEILHSEAEQRGITMRLDLAPELPFLWGDPVQIQQVLVNLARNAFDALAAQPLEPTLVMQTRLAESEGVEFTVRDNGEGIEPEVLDRVFEAYFSTRAGGMGMGLAICRTLIEWHQGRIHVTSQRGVGTTFSFTLPAGTIHDGAITRLHC